GPPPPRPAPAGRRPPRPAPAAPAPAPPGRAPPPSAGPRPSMRSVPVPFQLPCLLPPSVRQIDLVRLYAAGGLFMPACLLGRYPLYFERTSPSRLQDGRNPDVRLPPRCRRPALLRAPSFRKGNPMRVCFSTLGCKVNLNETEAMEQRFKRNGFTVVPDGEDADVYTVNSCTVTNFGAQKSRK